MDSLTVTLPRAIYDGIIAHAREGAPEEVCGIVAGRGALASELAPGRNEADNPRLDYWMDGETLLRQFEFEERGEEMIAIYHSHPCDEAYPSASDARNAFYPDAIYLICSLRDFEQPVIRAFRLASQPLEERPAGLQPVRGDRQFLARQQRDGHDDHYLLAFTENGRQHWRKVQVIELTIIGSELAIRGDVC